MVNLNNLFQSKRNSFVEIQNLGTEQIVIFCLKHIRNGFHPIGTCLIVFSSVGFTIGIFFAHQTEGSFRSIRSCITAFVFAFGSYCIIVCLLYFFEKSLFASLRGGSLNGRAQFHVPYIKEKGQEKH